MRQVGEGHPPLVAHVIFRLAVGGLENGLVNLINHMPPERYRHAIVCLTDFTDFRERIRRKEIPVVALRKKAGNDPGAYIRLWKSLRELRPAIVHTRNMAALEYLLPAALAGVGGRIHGEHGRDMYDLDGKNLKYNLIRRGMIPVVGHYIAVSDDLAGWLVGTVGVRKDKVSRIYNGVDSGRFQPPADEERRRLLPEGFAGPTDFVIGTVGRLEAVKDPLNLVDAFLHLRASDATAAERIRLVIVGDGALRDEVLGKLRAHGAESAAWMTGERSDVPELLRTLDLFILPSLREGISNTILEAMATGLPVVATRVGGNLELVEEGKTGMLVPPGDPEALAEAILFYRRRPEKLRLHGIAGRERIETRFSMEAMVRGYLGVYDSVLGATPCAA